MPRSYSYTTLDVFTSTAFKGNQLGIVTIPTSAPLTEEEKLSIAQEFNYSETIFVHEPGRGDDRTAQNASSSTSPRLKVDIFTTESELPFAGHPTIGAIYHALTNVFADPSSSSSSSLPPNNSDKGNTETATVTIELKAGLVRGTFDHHTGFASAEIPHNFHLHKSRQLGWRDVIAVQPRLVDDNDNDSDTMVNDTSVALVSIVRGMNFALVDLSAAPERLTKVGVTRNNIATVDDLDEGWPRTLIGDVFYTIRPPSESKIGRDNANDNDTTTTRIDQRVVVIGLEDAATGSASCALTSYLALKNGSPTKRTHRFELVQGEQMGRKSVIRVEVTLDSQGTEIEKVVMSGQCRPVMKGELHF